MCIYLYGFAQLFTTRLVALLFARNYDNADDKTRGSGSEYVHSVHAHTKGAFDVSNTPQLVTTMSLCTRAHTLQRYVAPGSMLAQCSFAYRYVCACTHYYGYLISIDNFTNNFSIFYYYLLDVCYGYVCALRVLIDGRLREEF